MSVGAEPIVYELFDSFNRVGKDGIVPNHNRARERHLGGHAMLVIGWRVIAGREYWVIVNSWGAEWGDGGICYIETNPSAYVFDEVWAVADNILPASCETIRTITFNVNSSSSRRVVLDGKVFEMPTPFIVRDGRTFVPLRFFSEALGCHVRWEGVKNRITISRDSAVIEMVIGSMDFTVDGNLFRMDAAPFSVPPGHAMVPLRFVSEQLGATVSWFRETGDVIVTRK